MSKPLNLTDMLWQRNDASGQDRAKETGSPKAAARGSFKRPKTDFIPEQAAPKAPHDSEKPGTVKSFHERVKESQARMSGKDHTFFKQPERPEAAEPQAKPAKAAKARVEGSPEAPAPAQERGMARFVSRKAAPQDGQGAETARAGAPAEAATDGIEAVRPEGLENVPAGLDEDTQGGPQGPDYDALLNRLEDLGIEASPEQLRDPAFLAEMLWMIDGIPMGLPLFPDAGPVEGETGILPADAASETGLTDLAVDPEAPETLPAGLTAAPGADAGTETAATGTDSLVRAASPEDRKAAAAGTEAVPAGNFDWTAVEEPEREEIAALIREKLGQIAEKPELRAGPAIVRSAIPDLPAAVQMARAGAERPLEFAAPEADPVLADPDRLRVMQNAGLDAALSRENASLAAESDLEADSADEDALPEYDAVRMNAAREGEDKDAQESLPDLLGRRSGAENRPEALGNRDAAASRDAGITPFQSAVDQARTSEARLAQAKAPIPQPHAPAEQSVLAQIARKFSALGAARGSEEIRIQLEPEHLGRVRIALEMREGALTARIAVENDSVRQIVDQNLATLKESLENQGIKIQGMEVSVEQRHASLFNPDGSNAQEFFRQRGKDGTGAAGGEAAADEALETDTGRRMGYNTMEYIA